ncbi:Dihydrofolate reductase [Amycolatopsis arida]|uniref:Dihydrofolate reductase n=1 Tax=Amycolatopsis arida TaxID=587909 RepID=A0A1I5ZE57_9PSEU|nr:dihydrofolate reductase family protein [Amycolatopsis arida]TDX89573.1 dihydrofolate reductase [Amycolatopsis arida]SFQ54756.1 Dihydrofolate reductase [Amycolatopsis arida]
MTAVVVFVGSPRIAGQQKGIHWGQGVQPHDDVTDGFIADPNDHVAELFEWYEAGEVNVPNPNEHVSFEVDDASAELVREWTTNTGALVSGRRLFDIADGWGDHHPTGAPVIVVTHQPPENADRWPRTTFVEGVEVAIARARQVAGDRDVTIASASVSQQALELGLVDEVCVSLVPVLFGEGIPYFTKLSRGHQLLDDPVVIQGRRALHLRYRVRR